MGFYLYCVLPAGVPEPTVAGLDEVPVRALRGGHGVVVWAGEVESAPRADLARIRAHDRVIRAAMELGTTPVPIRFGQVVEDERALERHLLETDYRPLLERVAGTVEFGIRIVDPEAAPPGSVERSIPVSEGASPSGSAPGSGAAYLKALAARLHEGEARQARSLDAAREIDTGLARWVRESRIEGTDQPAGALVAHLVQTDGAAAYDARARELGDRYPPLRIVVTGPWPPYSFVDR